MYFRYQQAANLLTINSDYAHLATVAPNGDMTFQLTYVVVPSDAMNYGATSVNVSVLSRYVAKVSLLGTIQRGAVDTRTLVNNIRSLLPDAKQSLLQRSKYVLAQTNSNISAYVNNSVLGMLQAQVPAVNIPQLNSPQLQLVQASTVKQRNDPRPILQRVASSFVGADPQTTLSGSTLSSPQSLMRDMLVRQGLDPSYVLQLSSRSQSADASRGGLINPVTAIETSTDPATQLLNYHLFPATAGPPPTSTDDVVDTELVQVLMNVTQSTVEVPVTVVLSAANLQLEGVDTTKVFVQFDLVNATTNEPIDTVIKTLNIARELQVYNTPKVPPIVKVASSPTSTRGTLQVRQLDPGATGVQVYKKTIFAAATDIDTYTLVGSYDLQAKDEPLHVRIDVPIASTVIYRVIPVGAQNAQGFEYSSAVVKAPRYTPIRSVALTGVQIDLGIQLDARNIPTNCVAVQFLKWNLTTHDSQYTIVSADVTFVDDAARAADIVTVIDGDVFDGNVYQYVARLIYASGLTEDFGNVTLEFVQPATDQVDTAITDLVVSHTTAPDVSFTVVTSTADTDIDAIKQMLGNQDLQQFFQGDLQAQRDQLQQLVAHGIQRVDLTTGVREDFGTVTTNDFVDSVLRKNRAIDPLQYGHVYRYEIYPLLRATETMFSSLIKSAVDPTTQKSYSFSPSKFLHPLALTRGVIVSPTGALQRYAKDPMAFGIVGALTTVEASFDNDAASITNQVASNFDRSLNIVSWQVQGDITQVDHFLIMKLVNGVRTMLGKTHTEFPYGTCQYFHQVTQHDNGGLTYVIIPVMNDYQVGQSATTNTLIVDAP